MNRKNFTNALFPSGLPNALLPKVDSTNDDDTQESITKVIGKYYESNRKVLRKYFCNTKLLQKYYESIFVIGKYYGK